MRIHQQKMKNRFLEAVAFVYRSLKDIKSRAGEINVTILRCLRFRGYWRDQLNWVRSHVGQKEYTRHAFSQLLAVIILGQMRLLFNDKLILKNSEGL